MSWSPALPLADLPQGRGFRLDIGDYRIALFRVEDEVYAIGDRCSHAEASLAEGSLFNGCVECPRHGSGFDLATGDPSALPATKPVPVYETRVEEGILMINLEATS